MILYKYEDDDDGGQALISISLNCHFFLFLIKLASQKKVEVKKDIPKIRAGLLIFNNNII